MTRRDRLERKLEKRAEWADKATARQSQAFNRAHDLTKDIPFGQPILVGHYSEGRHRRTLDRADSAMRRGIEAGELASLHNSKAGGLADQLERSIFSDDPDAVEAITARIEDMEAQRDAMRAGNAYYRKHKTMKGCPGVADTVAASLDADIPTRYSWEQKGPHRPYELSNLGGRITADRKRLEQITYSQRHRAKAEEAGGLLIVDHGGPTPYVGLTFAEKPSRADLDELKAAGFHWSAPTWYGSREKLPARYRTTEA